MKRRYRRYFIMFELEDKSFSVAENEEAKGYAKVEIKNNRGLLSIYCQNLRSSSDRRYMWYLINTKTDGAPIIVEIGPMEVDNKGKGETIYEFDSENVKESAEQIDNFDVLVLVARDEEGEGRLCTPLAGYMDKKRPATGSWRYALSKYLYIPLDGKKITGEEAAQYHKPAGEVMEESVGEAVEETAEETVEETTGSIIEGIVESPAREATEEIIEETMREIAEETAEELAGKIKEEIAEESTEKIIEEYAEEPEKKITEEITEKIAEEDTEEIIEETAEESEKGVVEEIEEKAAEETSEEVIKEVPKKPEEETAEETTEKIAEEFEEEIIEEAAEESKEEIVEEAMEELKKEPTDETTEKVLEEAIERVSGEAIEKVVEETSGKIMKEAEKIVDETEGEHDDEEPDESEIKQEDDSSTEIEDDYEDQMQAYIENSLKDFLQVEPFIKNLENYTWWQIPYDTQTMYRAYMPFISYLDSLKGSIDHDISKVAQIVYIHQHHIFGICYDENDKAKNYAYGILGRNVSLEQPFEENEDLAYWHPCDNVPINIESYGYWILTIDPKTGDAVQFLNL